MQPSVIGTPKGADGMDAKTYLQMPYEDIPEQILDLARAAGR